MILEIIASERRAKVHNSLPGCAFGLVAIASTRAWIISVSHTTRLCNVIGFRRYNRVRGWDIGFPNCARTATVILNLHLFPLFRLSFYLYLSLFSLPASSRFFSFFFSRTFFFAILFYPNCGPESSRVHTRIPDTATNARNDIRFEPGTHDSVISCRTRSPGIRSTQTIDPDYASPCIFRCIECHVPRRASYSSCWLCVGRN